MRTGNIVQRRVTARIAALAALVTISSATIAQETPSEPVNGMRPVELRAHAITGATVITAPGEKVENATIVIRNGVIEAVGTDINVPRDARIWPGDGLTVYPGLIDAALLLDVEPKDEDVGSHWNSRVHPELSMVDYAGPNGSKRKSMREAGFTAAAIYPEDGIFRGTGAVIALGDDDDDRSMYDERAAMMMGFDYGGGWSSATYPGSHMGSIALIRQTFYDAQWYDACRRVYEQHPQGNEPPPPADALAELGAAITGQQRVLFEVGDERKAIRAGRIADEFNLDVMLLGSGTEFRRLDQVVGLGMPIVLPLEFPDMPSVASLHEAQRTSLRELATWEQAPTNPRRLIDAGATVALTTHRLGENKFHDAVRKAIKHGLNEDNALAALTTTPAELLGLDHVLGTIEPGKIANLVVVEGNLFDKEGKIRDTWVNGRRYIISKDADITLTGSGTLVSSLGHEYEAKLDTTKKSFTIVLPPEADEVAADDGDDEDDSDDAEKKQPKPEKIKARKTIVQRDQVSCVIDGKPFGSTGYVQMTGIITGDTWKGVGRLADRTPFTFTVTITEKDEGDEQKGDDEQVASASGDGDSAARESAVAGRWNITVESDRLPQPINMVLSLVSDDDVNVTGTISMMGQDVELGEGTFSKDSGELLIETSNWPGGLLSIVASIEGEQITGTTSSERGDATFTGHRLAPGEDADDGEYFVMPPDELPVPLGAYGRTESPTQRDVLLRGATIWTAGSDGIIEQGDLYITDGVIEYVGPTKSWAFLPIEQSDKQPPRPGETLTMDDIRSGSEPLIIDASGMHITPGLIDCHSHTGIDGGVNEWTQVNTAEVRIADVIDPDDINWYRQLAGGLVACNQLHGSANPIGGQNSVVKLKWGGTSEDFLVDDAIQGIKFALGENVKRSQGRYPNTRMGVETVIRDAFTAARDYEQKWQRYLELPSNERARTMPPRRDLEMEAMVEILNGERLVHCHSYRQDEILMLVRVAESFGFTIGTFQHVLEGYKVAEAIGKHGAGASSFSDWWAYKVEVMDAIPHNGSLMADVGVNVSFNSDSSELARRMNTEASKAVRYGGMDPHEALKLVTINPAWQLRIDHRTGSLEQGKDGDFVIWNGDPLSTYTRCQQTWIEGRCYYDINEDRTLREQAEHEHQRLVQKVLAMSHGQAPSAESAEQSDEPEPGVDTQPTGKLAERVEAARKWMARQVQLGHDPETIHPGDCGCNDMLLQLMQTEVQR